MLAPAHEESFNSGAAGSGETIGWGNHRIWKVEVIARDDKKDKICLN